MTIDTATFESLDPRTGDVVRVGEALGASPGGPAPGVGDGVGRADVDVGHEGAVGVAVARQRPQEVQADGLRDVLGGVGHPGAAAEPGAAVGEHGAVAVSYTHLTLPTKRIV